MSHKLVRLTEIAQVFNGKTPARSEQREEGHPVLKIRDVSDDGVFRGKHLSFVDDDFYRKYASKIIRVGDSLILNAAHNADYVGSKLFFASDEVEGALATGEWLIVRPDPALANPGFINYWLRSNRARRLMKELVKGIHLYPRDVAELRLALPPLAEQRRIAAILEKADAVRRKRQEAVGLAAEFLRSVFTDLFGDPTTNPKSWKMMTIDQLCSERSLIVDGPFGSSLKPECYVDSGVRVIRNFNINDDWFDSSHFKYVTAEKFREISRSEVKPGDLLISTKGTIGDVCLMPEFGGDNVLSASGTVRVRLPADCGVMAEFLVSQMVDPRFKSYIKSLEAGSNQKYLTLNAIRSLQVIVPPIEAQVRFCEIKAQVRSLTQRLEAHEQQTVALLDSLSEELLSQSPRSSRPLVVTV